ncbi:trypsin-like peptidase domain-containing protein [Synechococcus sp. BL107]|uniref:trypsin-like peptidase domain-containing protein n=1 Tax=Synechococcus sp. BL107 TaxID=313625 RepID=UPI001E580E5B|nr:trypsin-like peptidase domain-containing protein [Synechococcus sp. BL107]
MAVGLAASAVVLAPNAAVAQDASNIARIAKEITVRVEGATQGSGVIVKKDGNTYTVLTAWHVLKSNQPGEEITLVINDNQYFHLPSSVKRVKNVDLATIKFTSTNNYKTARIASIDKNMIGSSIFVGGFPLRTDSVNSRIFRFLDGRVIAYDPNIQLPNGYNFLYSNNTLPGMSGGPVLGTQGELLAIHGLGEIDVEMTSNKNILVKTGTNQGIPLSFFSSEIKEVPSSNRNTGGMISSADKYLLKIESLLRSGNSDPVEIMILADKASLIETSARSEYYRAVGMYSIRSFRSALAGAERAISLDPSFSKAYRLKATINIIRRDHISALVDLTAAITLDPNDFQSLLNRASIYYDTYKSIDAAKRDLEKALLIKPNDSATIKMLDYIKNNS